MKWMTKAICNNHEKDSARPISTRSKKKPCWSFTDDRDDKTGLNVAQSHKRNCFGACFTSSMSDIQKLRPV